MWDLGDMHKWRAKEEQLACMLNQKRFWDSGVIPKDMK